MNVEEIIKLSELLGELGKIKRATLLPGGEHESDSHHSFSLALIAYDVCQKQCPELDSSKVVLYALAHDLLEIITGDEDTLHYDKAALESKHKRELAAAVEFKKLFANYPVLKNAMAEYERLHTPEAATVFVLDKACTTWTHFHDDAKHARVNRNLKTGQDIANWAARQHEKITARLKVQPPQAILDIYDASFTKLGELVNRQAEQTS